MSQFAKVHGDVMGPPREPKLIDGYFFSHNEQALKGLQNIITAADREMTLLSGKIDRARYGTEILTPP